jgi:hypothetical protein
MQLVFLVDRLFQELEHDAGVLDLGRDRIPEVRGEGEVRVVEMRGSPLGRNPLVVSVREADHVVVHDQRAARRPSPRWCALSRGLEPVSFCPCSSSPSALLAVSLHSLRHDQTRVVTPRPAEGGISQRDEAPALGEQFGRDDPRGKGFETGGTGHT